MNFELTLEQEQMRDAIERVCVPFDANYWLHKDREGGFPHDFHQALADSGWLGIAMPEEFGGAGLGISEAALVMHTISATGAGLSGASAVHMNIFGLHPVVVFGSDAQKARWLPPLIAGKQKACFGVTEPNTGLNTLKLKSEASLVARTCNHLKLLFEAAA
jgi:acyl-CoA dehydrogenase